jgi:AcrR family transcriptional regulator
LTSNLNDVNISLAESIPSYLNNVKIATSQTHHSEEESMTVADASRPYHHGNLRRALLDAALQVLTEEGFVGLTLRAVARRAGVSEAAPYHHFASKAALVEALVVETLQQLAQALQEATQSTTGTPLDQLMATGVAYVRFALEHRAGFQILYRPELRQLSHPMPDMDGVVRSPIDRAGMEAYQVLLDAIVACQQAGAVVPGDPLPLALTAWATVHGLAQLLLDGVVGEEILPQDIPPDATQLAHIVTATLVQGLVVRQVSTGK